MNDDAGRESVACGLRARDAVEVTSSRDAYERALPPACLIHELFEAQEQRTPMEIAVEHGVRSLTYSELNRAANRLAGYLRTVGVQPDQRVAICMERSVDMIVALLGVLKAGGAYVPLDPNYPAQRLEYMLSDAAPCMVLTSTALISALPRTAVPVLAVDASQAELEQFSPENLGGDEIDLTPSHLVYVIYTSGSTGQPKGIAMPHRSMSNLIEWHRRELSAASGTRVLQFAALSFDVAFQEIFSTLCTGGTLVLVDEWIRRDARALLRLLNVARIHRLFVPPLMLHSLAEVCAATDAVPSDLRDVIAAGEQLRVSPQIGAMFERLEGCRLHNHYGPTETHVVTTLTLTGSSRDWPSLPSIGRPIDNTQIHLVDEHGMPVPAGEVGEILISGANLARGYLGRQELTRQRFVQRSPNSNPASRAYKTGDLGRVGSDGTIEYLGRNDDQVKIRGFRVELGEVEARLALHPGVQQAAVVARDDAPGGRRLVAYIVPRGRPEPSVSELRDYVRAALPDYMMPTAVVALAAFPLTPSGKLDRRALPAPERSAFVEREYEPPEGEVEQALARIWRELLHTDRVGRHDNFFELGGHSLVAAQMLERLRSEGFEADVTRVFDSADLATLARAVRAEAPTFVPPPNLIPQDCTAITPQMLPLIELSPQHIELIVRDVPGGAANVQDIYPLAPLQEGILFHHLLDRAGGDTYVMTTLLALESATRLRELVEALQETVDHHDILRTAVRWEGLPRPVQVVYRRVTLPIEEVQLQRDRDVLEQMQARVSAEHQCMDIRQAPLMRLQVAVDPEGGCAYAVLQVHHIAIDQVTLDLLTAEVVARLEGRASSQPEAAPYRRHVAQVLARDWAGEAQAFFRTKLMDVHEPTAPFGFLDVHVRSSDIEEASEKLDASVAQRVRTVVSTRGVSAATLFHAAWGLVVAHASAREDIVFGSMLLGRMQSGAGMQRSLGMFINSLPLRLRTAGLTAEGLLDHTRRELAELLAHDYAPLALAQQCSGLTGEAPLFTSLLNYRHSALDSDASWSRARGVNVLRFRERTNYPVVMSIDDVGDSYVLTAQAHRSIDPVRLTGYLRTALQSLIEALETSASVPALRLSILPDRERAQLIRAFNDSRVPYPRDSLVHEMFEAQVQRAPGAIALSCNGQEWTYEQLNARANEVAHRLIAAGVRPDGRVGLFVARGPELIVGLLAILKAGGGYIPLDLTYPIERIDYMLRDSAPVAVLTQRSLRESLPPTRSAIISIDAAEAAVRSHNDNPQLRETGLNARSLAYVIYTSGSTGTPKGVEVEHRNAVNLIHWTFQALDMRAGSRCSAVAAIGFDAATWEIWPPLCIGATLVLAAEEASDPEKLLAWWASQRLDISFLPTPIAEFAFSRGIHNPGVRMFSVGGDRLRSRSPGQSFALINNYGPTEATVVGTSGRIRDEDAVLHIGRPIANTQVYILDARDQLAPLGVVGELCIGGDGVARGYVNRPQTTAERFIADPFSSDGAGRLYRTGDLGRWHPDGVIEFMGRNDHQVKIRGFRIELGEIEAQLLRHQQVEDAVVIAREDETGEKQLVAYVVPRRGEPPLRAEELRANLKIKLPPYMLPSAFVSLSALPLTPNGKVDRRALPVPDLSSYASRQYEAPQAPLEEILAGIWQDLLRVERVGRQDNFFELGGHSLLIVQMLERLRRIGLTTNARSVFANPTLAMLAGQLLHGVEEAPVPPNLIPEDCTTLTPPMLPLIELSSDQIERIVQTVPGGAANVQDIYPLAPLQEGILFHHLLDVAGDTYVLPTVLRVSSSRRVEELVAALQEVVNRHDVLRTAVLWEELPQPVQVVYRHADLPVEPIALDPDRDLDEQLREWVEPERQRLDLRRAPLMRVHVADDPDSDRRYVLIQLHHLTVDHVTEEILTSEVVGRLSGATEQPLDSVPYRNHVAHALAYARAAEGEQFFRSKLGDVDEPTTPFGLADVRGDGSQIDEASVELDPELAQRVRRQARAAGVSAATLFHAAFALLVARTSGRDDVVFGSVLLGRLRASVDVQRALGMFINTLPLRVKLNGMPARSLVESTQRELVELLAHEQSSLSLAQRCSAVPASSPLFTAILNYRHTLPAAHTPWATVPGIDLVHVQERTNYPLTVAVDDLGTGFILCAQTDRSVDPARVAAYLRIAVQSLVEALESAPDTPALELQILPESERNWLIAPPATENSAAASATLHGIFERQVERTPAAVAVTFEGRFLTYAQLNERANQLAHHLVTRGIGPDMLVGLCMQRGLDMVVGLLGILKAGAAYLPLDPNYPTERLAYMLEDALPAVVLIDQASRKQLPVTDLEMISIDEDWAQVSRQPAENIDAHARGLHSDHPAYVIYTSGSTGKPKGVVIEHRNVTRLFSATAHWFHFDEHDVWTLFHSIAFDFSVWELWGALLHGGRVVVVPYLTARSPEDFYRLLCEEEVTVLNQTPSAFARLIDAQASSPELTHRLRAVIFGGEALDLRMLRPWVARNDTHRTQLVNMYGITETTVHVTYRLLSRTDIEGEEGSVIGEPIPDLRVYLLDRHMQPVPVGVVGEMYVGGRGVSRGYLRRPALTSERFLQDPFVSATVGSANAHIYKTGDLARRRADGSLEYLGRNDQQVKIRGFRIELGEIETQLLAYPSVKECVVIAREDEPGEKRLVAYLIANDGTAAPTALELRDHSMALLPEYMVPSAFVLLQRLPLTANGKLDRRALPAPESSAYATRAYEEPVGETEEALAIMLRELLGVERVGRDDDFFELGGHSLLAMQLATRIRSWWGIGMPIRLLFRFPTPRSLAAQIDESRRARLLQDAAGDTENLEELLEQLASMSDSQAEALLGQVQRERSE